MAGTRWRGPRGLGGVIACGLAAGLFLLAAGAPAGAGTSSSVAQAKKHLLVLSDLPRGWKVEKGTGGSGGPGGLPQGAAAQVASCIGVPKSVIDDNSPNATGPYYKNKDASLEVQDSVSLFPSPSYARTQLSWVANPKTPGCLAAWLNGPGKSLIQAQAEKGETFENMTAAPLNAKVYGSHVTGFVLNLPVVYKGITVPTEMISVYAIRGRLGQNITYNAYGDSFPTALAKHLDAVALNHL
jgi:hypothetical protein